MKATLSAKGQVTIPKSLRTRLGLREGQVLEFVERDGALVVTKATPAGDPTLAVYGILGPRAAPTDELIEALRGPADGLDAP
ncbi:MAG: AbrB/MazE/SpoVT family DNA-binding domain-containing protein [Myxococcales bacterium]|nr:AbrB/MazE/SpoVT family DNA-binding domain-containing protein [Myxococcales bacterium]MCB9734557.1 AbrB/MazE/SpoVT family DNA-binding domain-containing protein [Deltaproteobacteria bacterium]